MIRDITGTRKVQALILVSSGAHRLMHHNTYISELSKVIDIHSSKYSLVYIDDIYRIR